MYIPNQRQESYPFSIAGKPIFHTWKNNFPKEEKQLSIDGTISGKGIRERIEGK
jgi:hypothetical protein